MNIRQTLLGRFFSMLRQSVLDRTGKTSSSRISSYFVLFSIILSSISFAVIEMVNAAVKWSAGDTYEIPVAHITLFGMILSHHLFLLGIVKNSKSEPSATKIDKPSDDA